jgi:hypothetical protein
MMLFVVGRTINIGLTIISTVTFDVSIGNENYCSFFDDWLASSIRFRICYKKYSTCPYLYYNTRLSTVRTYFRRFNREVFVFEDWFASSVRVGDDVRSLALMIKDTHDNPALLSRWAAVSCYLDIR